MKITEILVLHHSHLDVGFTHSQPILWELQREYVDLALDLLDETADWPEHSQPRWTCEVTSPVLKWLETAPQGQVDRFKYYLEQGRLGISAFAYNTTPLCTAEQLARQLYPALELRNRLGATINVLSQHDVNGIPWPMVDLMIDSGIELFVMAINNHFGGSAVERPSVFRWQGPSGREILVMNAAHYTMFDQLLYTWDNSTQRMQEGLAEYVDVLRQKQYQHDFIYLTTTNTPQMWDNAPPNPDVAKLIRLWNERGLEPPIRYVTTSMLLDRIKQEPPESLPVHRGDWTDHWNFGCASTAYETSENRRAKATLFTADLLHAARPSPPAWYENDLAITDMFRRAWGHANLFDEHTWSAYLALQHDHPHTRAQSHLKAHNAYAARELADYLLVNELEALADNPPQANHQEGVLLVNPTAITRQYAVPIPDAWPEPGKRLRASQHQYRFRYEQLKNAPLFGPVELPPFSWRKVPLAELRPIKTYSPVIVGDAEQESDFQRAAAACVDAKLAGRLFIESPHHRLEFDKTTGRILRLFDKEQRWEILPPDTKLTFFEFVHERPDPLHDGRRKALYERDLDKEKFDIACWKTDWKALRQGATQPMSCTVEQKGIAATLVLQFSAPSLEWLEQRVTLRADSPLIELEARLKKQDVRTPEAIYFAFPLNLEAGWRSHFDTAGVSVELDAEQLFGACRDWVTAESYVAVHTPERGASLFCPDAPMVQIGGFNFGRKQTAIPRDRDPLLLAWPLNNYWDTNFPVSQPGVIRLRYVFQTHGPFSRVDAHQLGHAVAVPVQTHPLIDCPAATAGRMIEISGKGAQVLHMKSSEDGRGLVTRLINLSREPTKATLSFAGRMVREAFLTSPMEVDRVTMEFEGDAVTVPLLPQRITHVRVVF